MAQMRHATEADIDRIRAINVAAYEKYLVRMDHPPGPLLHDPGVDVERGKVWVVGEPIVGFICLSITDSSLLIENVAVHPQSQDSGIGRQLMN